MPHFRAWSSDLILDTGESWHPEGWQEAFLADVFSGFRECWLIVPEGNGKTTMIAGLALYYAEHQPFASIPVAAASREQAEIMYRQAEGFVLRSERLHRPVTSVIAIAKGKRKVDVPAYTCLEGYRRINHHSGSRIQVFAADDRTGDGIIPTLGIIDEPHRQRDLSLYRTWAGKLEKRQGQIIGLSTSGEPGTDFETTRDRIRRSAETTHTAGSFTRITVQQLVYHEWAVPEGVDVTDMDIVKDANPFSGITPETLARKYASPTMTMQHWLRFVCNRPSRGDDAAITESEWAAAASDERIPAGEPIWLGLDVAWKWDTTAAVPLWWQDMTHRLLGEATVLTPPRDGTSLDPHAVEDALLRIHERNPVHTVVMDTNKAEQLGAWIAETLGAAVIDRAQTNTWAVADYEAFMEGLRSGCLKHSRDDALTQHALNAVAKALPYGDTRFDRPAAQRSPNEDLQERRVIDALTAASMVHSVALRAAQVQPAPVRHSFRAFLV